MYDHIANYSYRGKRPLTRVISCEILTEVLEGIFATVTNVDAGKVRPLDLEEEDLK